LEAFFSEHKDTIAAASAIATALAAIIAAIGLHVATRQFRTVITARLISARKITANSVATNEHQLGSRLYLVVSNRSSFPIWVGITSLTFSSDFSKTKKIIVPDNPFFKEGGRTIEPFSEHSIEWIDTEVLISKISSSNFLNRLTTRFEIKVPASNIQRVRPSRALRKAILRAEAK
jgi:hypothetical protein